MQILETKQRVTILTVGREEAKSPSGERLRQHLLRHGIEPEWVAIEPQELSIGKAIVAWCGENLPGMLVMGAYEHSKFREDMIGGTTNIVLKHITAPILMAH
jgi:nucleotide-binding universal stress UspA family protein